jgi:hypothetical protein
MIDESNVGNIWVLQNNPSCESRSGGAGGAAVSPKRSYLRSGVAAAAESQSACNRHARTNHGFRTVLYVSCMVVTTIVVVVFGELRKQMAVYIGCGLWLHLLPQCIHNLFSWTVSPSFLSLRLAATST